MITTILLFLAGILAVQQLTALPGLAWLIVGVCGIAVLARLRWWKVLFLLLGLLWAIVFAQFRLNERLPEHLAGKDIQVQGYIADLPEHEGNHLRFNFKVVKSEITVPNKVRLTWYYPDQVIKAGEEWQFTVRLKPPHGNFNPGGFDYERWLFVEGIGATGYVRPMPVPKLLGTGSVHTDLSVWRQYIAEQLTQTLANTSNLPMIKALTIGDGDSLSPEQWEIFRKTGTTHLMVISGSHIGLVAGLVYLLTIRLWARAAIMRWSPQKVAAITALLVGIVYAGLTGFSVPAQRAMLMIAVAMIAVVKQRNTQPFLILAIALASILVVDPLVVLAPGFWLSFIAVSLIIYAIAGRLGKPGFWGSGIKINWVTSVGLSPLLLFFFQQVSLISPVANLIAVPVISLAIVPLALLATLVMLIAPGVAEKLFIPVDFSLQGLWWVLVKLAESPWSTINHTQPSWWALGFAVPGVLLMFAPKGMPSRWLGLVMFCPLVFTETSKIGQGAVKLTLLDVGQGLSAVVQTANHTLVYDTGAKFSSSSDSGQSVVLPFLRNEGVEKIHSLIVSHGDNDHIGGVGSVMKGIKVEKLLTSVPQQLGEFTPDQCEAGQSWEWDQVSFKILSPRMGNYPSDNDNSCVLQIQSQQGSALLPGDIEAGAESWLVATYGNQLKSDVLISPHHGSQTSSTPLFLNAVNPTVVLIPAGYRNQFGHPHQDVLKHYQDFGIRWFNSADAGAIKVNLDKQLEVHSWREVEGKYWNYKK